MGLARDAENGIVAPRKIADAFRTTGAEVARTAGLGRDAVQPSAPAPTNSTSSCGPGAPHASRLVPIDDEQRLSRS